MTAIIHLQTRHPMIFILLDLYSPYGALGVRYQSICHHTHTHIKSPRKVLGLSNCYKSHLLFKFREAKKKINLQ